MYCIYAGKKIDESKSNLEHVIPLSLGGSDEFCIKVSEKYNSIFFDSWNLLNLLLVIIIIL